MTEPPRGVVVLGDANPDLVLRGDVVPRFGQSEQLLESAELVVGGSGSITAHALARLDVPVVLAADVGDDDFGRFMRERLCQAGVDCALLETSSAPTGLSVVLSDGPNRATLTLVGAIDASPPAWVDAADLPPARHLHVASYFLQPRRAAALPRLLGLARAAGLTTSLDTNLDPAGRFGGLTEVLPLVDVLLPNRVEAFATACAVAGYSGDDLVTAARAIATLGPTVVVKDGADGALLVDGDEVIHEPGMPVDPVDTTGAGDTFDAGYLAALVAGQDAPTRLRWACAAGALSTQAAGGTGGHPTQAELTAYLERRP